MHHEQQINKKNNARSEKGKENCCFVFVRLPLLSCIIRIAYELLLHTQS